MIERVYREIDRIISVVRSHHSLMQTHQNRRMREAVMHVAAFTLEEVEGGGSVRKRQWKTRMEKKS
jgi:hypothetical protein